MLIRQWVNQARATLQGDTKYHSLLPNGHANGHSKHTRSASSIARASSLGWPAIFHHKRARLGLLFGLLASVVLLVFASGSSDRITSKLLHKPSTEEIPSDESPSPPHNFRLLLPSPNADTGLCKTLVSSAILDYPTPVLINWNKNFHDKNLLFGGSGLGKIDGVLAHLNTLDSSNDDDLVMVLDSYDVWFQLRPSVLIERYFEIMNEENKRVRKQMGRLADSVAIEQKVLFSSQKRCWPADLIHPACFAVPNSTLPTDAYGEATDTDIGDDEHPYIKMRQRFLNSGSCIGPVSAVRRVFERAKGKMDVDKHIGSDQGIFAEIFGEQEFERQVMLFQDRGIFRKLTDAIDKLMGREYSYRLIDPGANDFNQLLPLEPEDPTAWEFGVSLDYESKILQATVFSELDTAWIPREDRTLITSMSTDKQIPMPPRVGNLPRDVVNSQQPFYSNRHGFYQMDRLPVDKTWNNVPLFTNMWTGHSPVAVHHNAHRHGLKARIHDHWPKTWFQPYARSLLDARALSPQHQIATTFGNGTEQSWYTPTYSSNHNERVSVRTDSGESINLDRLCAGEGIWDEIFRDGKGPWYDPRERDTVASADANTEKVPAEAEFAPNAASKEAPPVPEVPAAPLPPSAAEQPATEEGLEEGEMEDGEGGYVAVHSDPAGEKADADTKDMDDDDDDNPYTKEEEVEDHGIDSTPPHEKAKSAGIGAAVDRLLDAVKFGGGKKKDGEDDKGERKDSEEGAKKNGSKDSKKDGKSATGRGHKRWHRKPVR